jgi:hypothetical protein
MLLRQLIIDCLIILAGSSSPAARIWLTNIPTIGLDGNERSVPVIAAISNGNRTGHSSDYVAKV